MDLELKLALEPVVERAKKQLDTLQTEAATSTALVLPFLRALGYDPFDPTEVVPEFSADFGPKKGEKVDYAVMKDARPIMLIEVKRWSVDLGKIHESQLYRYYSVTPARISVLTNGVQYKFFADTENSNQMDSRPFLEFDVRSLKKADLDALRKFTKHSFDDDSITTEAQELLFTRGIVAALHDEFATPSDDFMRHFAKKVYSGTLGKHAKELFTRIVKRAQQQFLTEFFNKFSDRITSAINAPEDEPPTPHVAQAPIASLADSTPETVDDEIVTTDEERAAYGLVREIMSEVVNPARVYIRDTKSYCGVLLDDNNRRPICRLRFNHAQKYLGVFDAEKNEEKIPISEIDEIRMYAEQLRATVGFY